MLYVLKVKINQTILVTEKKHSFAYFLEGDVVNAIQLPNNNVVIENTIHNDMAFFKDVDKELNVGDFISSEQFEVIERIDEKDFHNLPKDELEHMYKFYNKAEYVLGEE